MKTEKLYYQNQYLKEIDAEIVDLINFGDLPAIVLNRTVFFPEGGGQTSDIGKIKGIDVIDVQESDGVIFHIVQDFGNLKIGDKVHCQIDWNKRFSNMQQHSGEHIFSGIIHNLYGLENVGFHLGKTAVTLDFPKVLTQAQLEKIENLANEYICQNRKITTFFPSADELSRLEFRSKKEITDELRLVAIEGVDLCACCAPHVQSTGEIGFAMITGTTKLRGGIRISILCGQRALIDARTKINQNKQISVLLAQKEEDTFEAVNKLKDELASKDFELHAVKMELAKVQIEGLEKKPYQLQCFAFSGDFLRRAADMLAEKADEFAMALSNNGDKFQFVMISKSLQDLNPLLGTLKKELSIKGGGRGNIVQGAIENTFEEIQTALEKLV